MGAVINFLVPVFHLVVFSGITYWIQSSGKMPKGTKPAAAAAWLALGGVLANVILVAMLLEVMSGVSLMSGQVPDDRFFAGNMYVLCYSQPVYLALAFFVHSQILKANPLVKSGVS